MLVHGVPETITRKQLVDLIKSLGIDPRMVTGEGVTLGIDSVRCTVIVPAPDWKPEDKYVPATPTRLPDGSANVLTHDISIRVVEDDNEVTA